MSTPLVSIISVNYNEPEETQLFLDSLYQSDYDNFETIIVDNGSKRKVSKELETKYPNLTCIIHDENLGFAGGNNLGIKVAKGEYLIFLNNDTLVPIDFIKIMVNFMIQNPKVGISSPKLVFPNGKIQYAGSTGINTITGRGKKIGEGEIDQGQFDDLIYETALAHGAAMIIPKHVIDEVGLMFEDYFLYYEEHDWCMAIKKAGYNVYFIGTTHVLHKHSVSVGIDSPLKVYYMNRNRLIFQARNYSRLDTFLSTLFYLAFSFPKSTIKYLLKGKKSQLINLWRALLWHINKKYDFKNF